MVIRFLFTWFCEEGINLFTDLVIRLLQAIYKSLFLQELFPLTLLFNVREVEHIRRHHIIHWIAPVK
jgi:hypothetical protein